MYGMSALAGHDRLYGTTYVKDLFPRWLRMLETEFTDGKGSLNGLRSYWTGLEMPFYTGEAGSSMTAQTSFSATPLSSIPSRIGQFNWVAAASATMAAPLIMRAAGEQRNSTMAAMSSGSA
jgi:Linalool dehydratase/isomerase